MKRWIAILCSLLCLSCVLTLCSCSCGGSIGKDTIDLSGVSLADATVLYDGHIKTLSVSGTLPEGVTVRYEYWNENDTEMVSDSGVAAVAVYRVYAIFSKNGCKDKTLNAKLTISAGDDSGINLSAVSFGDATVNYDGSTKTLAVSGTLPEGVTVRYEYWNEANTAKVSDSGVKDAATYTVRAIFSKSGCADRTLTAKLTVKEGADGADVVLKELTKNLTYASVSRSSAKATYTIVGATEDDNGSLGISLTIYDDSLGEDDILKMPYYVPVTSSNGQVNMGNKTAEIKLEGAVSGNIAATDVRKLSLDKSNFKGGKYTWENYVFKATVTNAQAFFGVTLEAAPDEAEVTITMRPNGQPVKMEVAYNTASGNQVRITVNYSYN